MSNLDRYPDAWVLIRPSAVYRRLVAQPYSPSRWDMVRRPLLAAFILGCVISLMASGRVSLRLAVSATVYWAAVPFIEIASLALVWPLARPKIRFSRAIDLYFMGHGPWSLVLLANAAIWAFLPPVAAIGLLNHYGWLVGPALVAMTWSGFIGFYFFHRVLAVPRGAALAQLALQRLVCWVAVLSLFLASAGWQVVATRFGL